MSRSVTNRRRWPRKLRRVSERPRDEQGTTLIEIGVGLLLLTVFFTAAMITFSTFIRHTVTVSSTYANADTILPVTNTLDRYFRASVEPGPGLPAVQVATATQFKFTTNTGNANGPEQVNATIIGGPPVSSFQLTLTPPDANSCPLAGNGYTGTCTWGGSPRIVATVPNVPTVGGLSFYYLALDQPPLTMPPTTSCSYTPPPSASIWPPVPTSFPPSSGGWSPLAVWTQTPTTSWCWVATPLDQVWAVSYNIVALPTTGSSQSRQNTTYLFSTTSYQYSKSVG